MSTPRILAFAQELTKVAKPKTMGTLLGQNVTATVKHTAKKVKAGMPKKAGPRAALLAAQLGAAAKKKGGGVFGAIGRGARHAVKTNPAGTHLAVGSIGLAAGLSRSKRKK